MIWPLLILLMSDENPQLPSTASPDDTVEVSGDGVPTMGGRQFWGDVSFRNGWKIQRNVFTGHHRLLDGDNIRHATGSLKKCHAALEGIARRSGWNNDAGEVVILVHGIGRSSSCFTGFATQLRDDGYTVILFEYPSTQSSISENARFLHSVVDSLQNPTSVSFVCHSVGGLVLRSLVQQYPEMESRVHRAVMLGTPNQGAKLADMLKNNPAFKLILGPSGQELVSDTEGEIAKLPIPQFEFGIVAGGRGKASGYNPLIPGDNDITVSVRSARLPGASDFLLVPVIHTFLTTDQRVLDPTRFYLRHGVFVCDREPQPIPTVTNKNADSDR